MTARAHSAAILFSPAPALCYPSRKGAQLDRLFAIGEGIGAFLGGIAQGIGAVVAALLLAIYGLRQWRAQVTRDRDKEREAAEHRRNEARERRRDRERDILIGIRAEVSVEIESLRQFDPAVSRAWEESFIEKLRDRPAAQDGATQPAPQPTRERHETPVGSSTATMFVFDDLKHDLELIPPNCIEEIVRYYKYNQRLDKVIEDFGRGLTKKRTTQDSKGS